MKGARSRAIVMMVLAALAVAGIPAGAAARPRPILILPFQPTAVADDGWFGEGIAETLFAALQATPALLPIDRGRAALAARVGGDAPAGAPDKAAALPPARALKAGTGFFGDYPPSPQRGVHATPAL